MQRKSARFVAISYASLFALIFGFYAYSLYFGGLLKWNEVKEGDELYSGGKVVGIMFCIVFGAMQFGSMGPAATALQQARVGAKLAVNVIDQVPTVDPNKTGGKVLTNNELKGQIEFKNVCFTYPTR